MTNRRWNPSPVVFVWTLLSLGLTGLCAIPTVSARWQRWLALEDTGGGERAGVVHAPMSAAFVSFVTLRVYGDQPRSAIEIRLREDGDPQSTLRLRLEKDGQGAYSTTITPPRLFTSGAIQLHVFSDLPDALFRIGNDRKRPVRSPLRLWWPWLLIVYVSGTAILLHPSTARVQALLIATVQKAAGMPPAMLLLLLSAAGIRTFLVLRGGQYFDLDEGRYTQVARVLELLRTGDLNGAIDAVLRAPDHIGFRVIGLFPGLFHVASAFSAGQSVAETRHASGEWLPAWILSLASVGCIALTYGMARRIGASRHESTLAAALMWASGSMLMYARHLMPYDIALLLLLGAAWLELKRDCGAARTYASGLIAGCGFLTYAGYWLGTLCVAILSIGTRARSLPKLLASFSACGLGIVTVPALLVIAAWLKGVNLIDGMRGFSRTVTHGEFSEGLSLPFEAAWHTDGLLALLSAAGIVLAACFGRKRWLWLTGLGVIYGGLVLGSNVFHAFVVYDRISRQMLPLAALAAAHGFAAVSGGNWIRGTRGGFLLATVLLMGCVNARPHFVQRFPREFVRDVIAQYGERDVSVGSTLAEVNIAGAAAFLPLDVSRSIYDPRRPTRYVLFDVMDLWVDQRIERLIIPPLGRVLRHSANPRQHSIWQYHGFTARQRQFLRHINASMRLIEVDLDGMGMESRSVSR
jgi:hypothetical protein